MPTDPSTADPSDQPRAAATATAAAAAAEPTAANPKKRRYSDYLRGVELRFQNLTENVLPSAPYLTYPKVQRPVNDRWLVNNWCVGDGSVFSRDEEHLQYMTFLSYQDWDTALVAVGGWSDAFGNVMREEKRPPKVDSSTVSDASASAPKTKKKITLSDYNVKKTTIKGTQSERETLNDDTSRVPKLETLEGAKTPVRHHHTQQENPRANSKHNQDKEEVDRGSSHAEHVSNPKRDTETLSSDGDQKRTRPASPGVKQEKDSHLERPALDTSHNKSPISDTPSTKQPPPSSPDERTLPPLLSPTLPSPLIRDYPRAKEVYGFEPILSRQTSSPEAPLSETALSLQKKQGSSNGNLDRAAIKASSSSSATSKPTKSNDVAAHRQGIPSKEKPAVEREDRVKTTSKTTFSDSSRLSKPSQITRQSRLIVKLKYGRANAQRVIKILKMGRSHRTNTSEAPKASKTIVTGAAPSISSKTVKKRPMQSDNDSPRSQSVASRRSQPTKGSTLSNSQQPPSSSVASTRKNNEARKRPVAGGHDSVRLTSRSFRNSTGALSPALDEDSQEWTSESMKYWELARELRLDGRGCPNEAFGTVLHIESHLALILKCAIQEKLKATTSQDIISSWETTRENWTATEKRISNPTLRKLWLLLGGLLHSFLHERYLESAAENESKENARTSKGAGEMEPENESVSDSEQGEKPSLIANALSMYRLARRYWLKGSELLSTHVIKDKFPETWRKLQDAPRDHIRELEKPGKYHWTDIAPLSTMSTPFEAVRFFYALLGEWASQQKLDWTGQLDSS